MNTEINTAFVNAILADASYVEGFDAGHGGAVLLQPGYKVAAQGVAARYKIRFHDGRD